MNTETAQRVLELELPRLRDSEATVDVSRNAATIQGSHVRLQQREGREGGAWWHGLRERVRGNERLIMSAAFATIVLAALFVAVFFVFGFAGRRSSGEAAVRAPGIVNPEARVGSHATAAAQAADGEQRHSSSAHAIGAANERSASTAPANEKTAAFADETATFMDPGTRGDSTPSGHRGPRRSSASSPLPASGLGEFPGAAPQNAEDTTNSADVAAPPPSTGVDLSRPIAPLSE